MNTFTSSLFTAARTENGMRALSTTSNPALDLFGSIGASRGQNIIPAFEAALRSDPDLAIRIAQWARDVRGGAGERQIYRDILLYLEKNYPEILTESNLLLNTAEIGRFDDLLIFQTPEVKGIAYNIIAVALSERNGLCAKWMPRKGPIAAELREAFGLSPKMYRKILVSLTKVVEQQMCAKDWNEINFSHVPSVAMTRYMAAFARNAPERFAQYKEALTKGEAKVNASAVYPYNVLATLGGARDLSGYGGSYGRAFNSRNMFNEANLPVAQAMWDALPNYMTDANVLAVVDNSGSMQQTIPGSNTTVLDVAVSLGMYTASKSTGAFRDLSVSFSDNAEFCVHKGNLIDRMTAVCSMSWGSTNLHSVFELILNHAKQNRVPQEDMPRMILIMSDMQFNADRRYDDSAQQMIRRKYEQAGYSVPIVVYWNLADRGNKPVSVNDKGVALVSGFSPAIMKSVLAADTSRFTPEGIMRNTVCIERYDW